MGRPLSSGSPAYKWKRNKDGDMFKAITINVTKKQIEVMLKMGVNANTAFQRGLYEVLKHKQGNTVDEHEVVVRLQKKITELSEDNLRKELMIKKLMHTH
jgi:RNase P protein component